MQKVKYRISGHETFAFRFAWLPKAVNGLEKNPMVFSDENHAMVELGVGKNMVKSIKFWAQQTGVIQKLVNGFGTTSFGLAIFGSKGLDPYLEDQQTLWLLHWKLSTNPEPLFAWYHLLNFWQEPELVQSVIATDMKRLFSEKHTPADSSIKSHLNVFFHTYAPARGKKNTILEENLDCPLVQIRLLEECGYRQSDQGTAERAYQFRREIKPEIGSELFIYCLIEFWMAHAADEETLSFNEIAHSVGSPGQILKLSEQDILNRLEEIEDASLGVITFMQSALLKSVKRNMQFDHQLLMDALGRIYA